MQIRKNRCDVAEPRFLCNHSSKSILDTLKASQIWNGCAGQERIAEIKSGANCCSSYGTRLSCHRNEAFASRKWGFRVTGTRLSRHRNEILRHRNEASASQERGFRVAETRLLRHRNEAFASQEGGIHVTGTRLSRHRNEAFTSQEQGFRVTETRFLRHRNEAFTSQERGFQLHTSEKFNIHCVFRNLYFELNTLIA